MGTPRAEQDIYGGTVQPSIDVRRGESPFKERRYPLNQQLDRYLNFRREVTPRNQREAQFLRETFGEILASRDERAEAHASEKVQEAITIAGRLMPLSTYEVLCMDSRVNKTLMFGLPMGLGGSMRVPGGDLSDFVFVEGNSLAILPDADFDEALSRALDKNSVIVQVLDSHVGCAARVADEDDKGLTPEDAGLYADVVRKKQMAEAITAHVNTEFNSRRSQQKRVLPIQTSFNPETGYLYMGLEQDHVLASVKETGFTPAVLQQLVKDGKIFSTEKLITDRKIKKLFEAFKIDNFDWESNYADTMHSFWKNMEQLTDKVTPIIKKMLGDNPDVDWIGEELDERAMLLMLNAYNAFHLNYDGREYPYKKHKETYVVTSEAENGPYENHRSFSVYSKAMPDYGANIKLATKIVRANRTNERIIDETGVYPSSKDFGEAPVPVLHEVIIRENVDWNMLREMVWQPDFFPENWYSMDSGSFRKYISRRNSGMTVGMLDALATLRDEMAAQYNRVTGKRILEGNLELVPVLVNRNLKAEVIVPLIHKGHPRYPGY